ncbi:prepilin-type N-terminal cleavage/methylation domain-containing protein [Synechococcus sp. AH-229-G18]|nr:prepilin-type N-terminal cleavage/methylation domain-containing protein [Synechococcus sp. AH-229-G18]
MKILTHLPNNRHSQHLRQHDGFSLIELIVSVVILAIVGMMAVRISSQSMNAMQKMSLRSKVDSAIAARMEDIRTVAFGHLCTQGCDDEEVGQKLIYDTISLETLCENKTLGVSLLAALSTDGISLVGNFNLTDYDQTADSIQINSSVEAIENEIEVELSESITNTKVMSTIVPHAHGWCP